MLQTDSHYALVLANGSLTGFTENIPGTRSVGFITSLYSWTKRQREQMKQCSKIVIIVTTHHWYPPYITNIIQLQVRISDLQYWLGANCGKQLQSLSWKGLGSFGLFQLLFKANKLSRYNLVLATFFDGDLIQSMDLRFNELDASAIIASTNNLRADRLLKN